MIGNIRLYKSLGLKQDNTMYFASLQDQQTFFNAPPNVQFTDYDNVSYNGARAFKININFLSFMFLEYDYLRFEYPNGDGTTRTIYAFINDITYVNDNCCAIDSTIDVIQTFMFEIFNSYKYGVIKNYTLDQYSFNKYLPYNNKYSVNDYSIKQIAELSPNKEEGLINCGWILITIDNNMPLEGTGFSSLQKYTIDNGFKLPFIKVGIPVVLSYTIDDDYDFYYKHPTQDFKLKLLKYSEFVSSDFYKTNANYILDVSICSTQISNEKFVSVDGGIGVTIDNITPETDIETFLPITIDKNDQTKLVLQIFKNLPVSKIIPLNNLVSDTAQQRMPYQYIKIGNGFSNIDVNLLDFYDDNFLPKIDTNLYIEYITSLTFPYQVSFKMSLFGEHFLNEFKNINTPLIVGASDEIIYQTSAWSEYVSQNKQYASMGLATQQKYEKQAFDREISYERRKNRIDTISGVVGGLGKFGLGFAQSMATDGAKGLGTMASGYGDIVSSGIKGYTGLLGIRTKQDVFAIEQEKDRAMQQIQFNDIKTSPSNYDNMTAPTTSKTWSVYYPLCVYLYTARNIDAVKKYHEIFGYEINKPLNNFSFASIRNHENFDYISFVSLFIKANIPRDMEETIEQILTNGVRFWYDYTKFLDYSLPNNEVT